MKYYPAPQLKISPAGLDFIAQHEGFVDHPYNDPAGYATIGYGHLLHRSRVTQKDLDRWGNITKAEGKTLLIEDLNHAVQCVHGHVTVPITQGMFDALVDFVYNAGCGNFKRSTLLKRLNQKKYTEAAIEFGRWVYSNHRILNGLVIRRAHETTLFLS